MSHDSKTDGSNVIVRPARTVRGVVRIPGDKSISHRYAMLAAIAEGTSRFQNFSAARDCASTLDCVAKLGCEWKRLEDGAIEVHGVGPRLKAPAGDAGLRELRLDHAHAERNSCRPAHLPASCTGMSRFRGGRWRAS